MLQEYDDQFQDPFNVFGQFAGYPQMSEPMWVSGEGDGVPSSVTLEGNPLGEHGGDGSNLADFSNSMAHPWSMQAPTSTAQMMNDYNKPSSSSIPFSQHLHPTAFQAATASSYQDLDLSEQPFLSTQAPTQANASQGNPQLSVFADSRIAPESWSAPVSTASTSTAQLQGLAPYMTTQLYQTSPSTTEPAVSEAKARDVQSPLPLSTPASITPSRVIHQTTVLPPAIPAGGASKFRLVDVDALNKSIQGSKPLTTFLVIGTMEVEIPNAKGSCSVLGSGPTSNVKSACPVSMIPKLEERQSVNQLQKSAVNGPSKCKSTACSTGSINLMQAVKLDRVEKKRNPSRPRSSSGATAGSNISLSSSSDSDSDSESDADSSSDEEEIEESPLAATRPTNPLQAVEYDVIETVWHPKSKYLKDDTLLTQIGQFAELFWKLRDDWKKANESVKHAVESKSAQVDSLKKAVTAQRNILAIAVNTAIKHGHPEVLQTLGQNTRFLASLQPILLDRAKDGDHNGPLSVSIFKLLSLFKGVTMNALEATKLTKILSAFSKKGNDEVKALVKGITDRATAAKDVKATRSTSSDEPKTKLTTLKEAMEKRSLAAKAPGSPKLEVKTESKPKIEAKPADSLTGLKRSRPVETTGATVKRVNTGTTLTTAKPTATLPSVQKKPLATVGSKSSANAPSAATKVKASSSAPKAMSSFFSSMQSAAKKTPAAEKPASTSASGTAPAPASTTSFSLGMLDDILKYNEPQTKSKTEEVKREETEEEKVKRLRKETRRKLRVSWKSDAELVAVRFFSHEPEEDTGHDASLVRDVTNLGNEGRMFKQLQHKDNLDMDAEDEEKEESFGKSEYHIPSDIDQNGVIDQKDLASYYIRNAGASKEPDSADRKIQEERESNTLMEIYFTREDIPSRPRSPADPYTKDEAATVNFGAPAEPTASRLSAMKQAAAPPVIDPALSGAANLNVQDLIKALALPNAIPQSTAAVSQAPPPNEADANKAGSPLSVLESIFAQYSTPVQTQAAPPAPAPPPAPVYPQYSQPAATSAASNPYAALLGFLPTAPPQFPTPPPHAQQESATDVSSIIAALSAHSQPVSQPAAQSQQQEYTPPAPSAPFLPPPLNASAPIPGPEAFLAMLQASGLIPPPPTASASTPIPNPSYDNPDRKRIREEEEQEAYANKRQNSGASNGGRGGGSAGAGKKWQDRERERDRGAATKSKSFIESKKYSQACKFWPLGKCMKGSDCTYRHDPL
jgi:hypothetical protein